MQVGLVQCVNKGMQRDYSIDKASQEFAYENKNIRITTTGDNSFLSVTNEKSTTNISLKPSLPEGFIVLGSASINDIIVLFGTTGTKDNPDYILTVTISENEGAVKQIYNGTLEFSTDNPIECITSYESDAIQKVYWVDGKNQPRVINICKTYKTTDSFDFTPKITEDLDVSIEKEYNGTGQFTSGVIQYFITYYKKYGSETNAVYTSPLYYISPQDRGGKVDETQTCSFKITITPKVKDFDYIRVYSIIRTSLNITTAFLVADVECVGDSIVIIDTNNNTPIAPTDIMFLGGNTVVASTIEQKDNTLFLGNITTLGTTSEKINTFKKFVNDLRNKDIDNKTTSYKSGNTTKLSSCLSFNYKVLDFQSENTQYQYDSNLKYPSNWIKGFKLRELYRIGIQFQKDTNEWSPTIWLEDVINKNHFPQILSEQTLDDEAVKKYFLLNGNDSNNKLLLPYIKFTPDSRFTNYFTELKKDGFKKYRLVMAEPTYSDRCIISQGYVNPTLFRLGRKIDQNTNQNSWLIRPINNRNKHLKNINNTKEVTYEQDGEKKKTNAITYDSELDITTGSKNCFEESSLSGVGQLVLTSVGVSLYVYRTWMWSLGFIPTCAQQWGVLKIRFGFSEFNSSTQIMNDTIKYTKYVNATSGFPDTESTEGTRTYSVLKNLYDDMYSVFTNLKYKDFKNFILEEVKKLNSSATEYNIGITDNMWNSTIFKDNEFVHWDESSVQKENVSYLKSKVPYNGLTYESVEFKRDHSRSGGTSTEFVSASESSKDSFYLDASTISFNSPNLDKVNELINHSKFRIVGKTDIIKCTSDYKIQAEDGTNNKGGYTNDIYKFNFRNSIDYNRDLSIYTGKPHVSNPDKIFLGLTSFPLAYADEDDHAYFVNIWNKSGSLVNKKDDAEGPTSKLKSKTIANFWIGNPTEYYYRYTANDGTKDYTIGNLIYWEYPTRINNFKYANTKTVFPNNNSSYEKDVEDAIYILDSNENKIKIPYIDRVSTGTSKNSLVTYLVDEKEQYEDIHTPTTNISIKYNSTNHGVFSFRDLGGQIITLPGYTNPEINSKKLLFTTQTCYPNIGETQSYVYRKPLILTKQDSGEYTATISLVDHANYNTWLNREINNTYYVSATINNNTNIIPLKLLEKTTLSGEFSSSLKLTFSIDYKSFIYKDTDGYYYLGTPASLNNSFGEHFVYTRSPVKGTLYPKSQAYISCLGGANLYDSFTLDHFGYHTFKAKGNTNSIGSWLPMNLNSNNSLDYLNEARVSVTSGNHINNSLWVCEFYRDLEDFTPYGGVNENAIETNKFIPISDPTNIGETIHGLEGDTYFQRWDSLRVYPTDTGEEQSVVDVVSLMLETYENLDGRSDVNRGREDIISIRPNNIEDNVNDVYSQSNNYTTSSVLDEKFEDATHPTLYTWSLQKQASANIDNWTSVNLSSSLKLDGDKGILTKIKRWNNQLLAFQEKGLAIINFNQQTTISNTEGVPIEIANSGKVTGHYYVSSTQGCKNKWTITDSPYGLYFIDSYNKSINVFGSEGIKSLSTINLFQDWIVENEKTTIWNPLNDNDGFKSFYDSMHKEVYFVNNKTALCYNELLSQFTSFYDYGKLNSMLLINGYVYGIKGNKLHRMFEGNDYCNLFDTKVDYSITYKINKDPLIDKTWTNIEYKSDIFDKGNINNSPTKTMETFDSLEIWNEYQYTMHDLGKARPKFRVWRAQIPRDKKEGRGLNRIRNPWIMLKLSKENNTSKRMEFHDLVVKYLQ